MNGWTKQGYKYTGILDIHKKEWHAGTCYKEDASQKHNGKWKKPDLKSRMLQDSLMWNSQNR